jgi:hypothetical protein
VGLFIPALHVLYDAAWFTGTATSGVVYMLATGRQKMSSG